MRIHQVVAAAKRTTSVAEQGVSVQKEATKVENKVKINVGAACCISHQHRGYRGYRGKSFDRFKLIEPGAHVTFATCLGSVSHSSRFVSGGFKRDCRGRRQHSVNAALLTLSKLKPLNGYFGNQ